MDGEKTLESGLSDQLWGIAAAGMDVPFHGWADVELQICSELVKIVSTVPCKVATLLLK